MSTPKDPDPDGEATPASVVRLTALRGDDGDGGESPSESLEARLAHLGRVRPAVFTSARSEVFFLFSVMMSQFLTDYFVSGFTLILPSVIRALSIPASSAVWPTTAFSLVIAGTLLVFGRLGDMFGGRPVFQLGLAWLLAWSVAAGFSGSPVALDVCRALQGLGAAAALPTGVMLIGTFYRPGPRKNFVFAMYGLSACLGFFGGIVLAGVVGQALRWGWYFWIGALLAAVALAASLLSIPDAPAAQREARKAVTMDWLGAATIVPGLVLAVFAVIQSAHARDGWRTPYVPACFALGVLLLLAAAYVEARVAEHPLLPAEILAIPRMAPLLAALMLLFGCWGIFSVFGTLYLQEILGASPLQVALWYVPLGASGLLVAVLEGFVLHLVPGRALLVVCGASAVGAQLLLALIPPRGWSYWAYIFPATVLVTLGVDLAVIVATVFITTKLPLAQQGLAGGILNSALQLGVALVLAWAELLQSATLDARGLGPSYKNAFWLGVAAAALALLILALWGSVPRAQSELTADERAELVAEAERDASAAR